MRRILDACRRHKVPAGLHCGTPEEARQRIADGWQFVAIASELRMLLDSANEVVRKIAGARPQAEMAKY
jgi:4-hydroxy-2-oxoheptanedioate aldolase